MIVNKSLGGRQEGYLRASLLPNIQVLPLSRSDVLAIGSKGTADVFLSVL